MAFLGLLVFVVLLAAMTVGGTVWGWWLLLSGDTDPRLVAFGLIVVALMVRRDRS